MFLVVSRWDRHFGFAHPFFQVSYQAPEKAVAQKQIWPDLWFILVNG